jgi:uncharacterized protein YqiB (DUF1249 family)
MLVDTSEQVLKFVRPRSFAGLMTLYESNYQRFRQLLGPLDGLRGCLRSDLAGEPELTFEVFERAPYTTRARMTYWFEEAGGASADPDLIVKLYHDARMAEVISCRNGGRHRFLGRFARAPRSEIRRRWMMNMMLSKWLEYCIDRHHFADQPGAWPARAAR